MEGKGFAWHVLRWLVPPGSEIETGPPVARVLPFTDGLLALGIALAYVGGIPTPSSTVLPLFVVAPFLLACRKSYIVTTGYVMLSVGSSARAATVWWTHIPDGQKFTASVLWIYLAYRFALSSRMVWARGVRAHR